MQFVEHVFYINLDKRPDRKAHVQEELNKVGLKNNAIRFKAVEMKNGAVGCTLSHLRILKDALSHQLSHVLIVEDDIQFLNPDIFVSKFNDTMESLVIQDKPWDVILLGGNNVRPIKNVHESYVQVTGCQTTTGYLVNGHYISTLIENITQGLTLLLKSPENHALYAIDKYWFHLQVKDIWFLIVPLSVIQRPDYSDIEKKQTNYTKCMLKL